ncbi:MAG: ComEA family DNA-binding protein [Coriobacteriia bacterium]|nr:ComEA family DNA-binding protein [Coriobacteriia bacterium]
MALRFSEEKTGIAAIFERMQIKQAHVAVLIVVLLMFVLVVALIVHMSMKNEALNREMQAKTMHLQSSSLEEELSEAMSQDNQVQVEESATTKEAEKQLQEEEALVVVHVSGAVKDPGVYQMGAQARIHDAIELAGGIREDGIDASINLAAKVSDGMKITIPSENDAGEEAAQAELLFDPQAHISQENSLQSEQKININTAQASELMSLDGIGEKTAQSIIKDREKHGPFRSVDDLTRVGGIGEKKLENIRDAIYAG